MDNTYLQHIILPSVDRQLDFTNQCVTIAAKIADLTEEAVYQEIIRTATAAGITDLYLMDKTFVLEALKEKLEREKRKKEEQP